MPKKTSAVLASEHENTKVNNEIQHDQPDPQLYINLISILDAYFTEKATTAKPFLVKDGVKIIL